VDSTFQKIRFFRERIPTFACKSGCHDCCGPVTTSSEEMSRLPRLDDAVHEAALTAFSCPHLGPRGCTVYKERPLVCRLFGTTPRMPCPEGQRPEEMIDERLEQDIHRFFKETRQVLV
jgi:uncharacterized protein